MASFKYPERAGKYIKLARKAEKKYGLPTGVMESLLYQESRYRPDIIKGETRSGAGATGIAQIVPKWHPGVDPLDPEESIDYAAGYLSKLTKQFDGDIELGLAAYNWGPGNLRKYGQDGSRPKETSDYVSQILGRLDLEREAHERAQREEAYPDAQAEFTRFQGLGFAPADFSQFGLGSADFSHLGLQGLGRDS
jgi:membrane-bound lytic murein transglycosylase MltF